MGRSRREKRSWTRRLKLAMPGYAIRSPRVPVRCSFFLVSCPLCYKPFVYRVQVAFGSGKRTPKTLGSDVDDGERHYSDTRTQGFCFHIPRYYIGANNGRIPPPSALRHPPNQLLGAEYAQNTVFSFISGLITEPWCPFSDSIMRV